MAKPRKLSGSDDPFTKYLGALEKDCRGGIATEHTHRPTLKTLVESVGKNVTATNEPHRVHCGAPDFVVTHRSTPLGYIEAKDVGEDLAQCANTEQLIRYRKGLANLLLTDYLDFHWYVNGELRDSCRLGSVDKRGRLTVPKGASSAVGELIRRFLASKVPLITNADFLAARLAAAARIIRGSLMAAMEAEGKRGALHDQLTSFRKVLVHSLKEDAFCDMYAQTICYGLFAARCECNDGRGFSRDSAAALLPRTNPFLRQLFGHIAGHELDDRIAWAVDDLAHTLERTDVRALLEQFGALTGKNDPVLHFYETFLKEYDRDMREDRGVYYTPKPVVSFIVRSVDALLQEHFSLAGLHDTAKDRKGQHRLLILDPAVGTGTFLHEVISLLATRCGKDKRRWSTYVSQHVLPRLCGFEFLMAPYTIAHLKLGLQLAASGYDFSFQQRLKVYLTNTLDEAHDISAPLFEKWLAIEANEASAVKRDYPVMVIVGNPPYSIKSQNDGDWIKALLKDYKKDLNERKLNLDDDFIKFFRFAQWRIERTGYGILGFITNNTYLDGITHRQMRKELLRTFDEIWILNLHGDAKKGDKAPGGLPDHNVFDIQQGVAIGLFVRKSRRSRTTAKLHYADLWGTRAHKFEVLEAGDVATLNWKRVTPDPKYAFFVPKTFTDKTRYESFPSITDIFPVGSSAIQTKRDALFTDLDPGGLAARMREVINEGPTREMQAKYPIADSAGWQQSCLASASYKKEFVRSYLFRPFDYRHIYYDPNLLGRARLKVFQHFLMPNLGLATLRQTVDDSFRHVFCTDRVCDINLLIGHHVSDQVFPLFIYQGDVAAALRRKQVLAREPNISNGFLELFAATTGMTFTAAGNGDLRYTFGPEDVFAYVYAVLHHADYRRRYWEMLNIEFPRIPVAKDRAFVKVVCGLGRQLIAAHTQADRLRPTTTLVGSGSSCVERVIFKVNTRGVGEVWINKEQAFVGVVPEDWALRIGAHQVCRKWLKDRVGVTLQAEDIRAYTQAVAGVAATRQLAERVLQKTGPVKQWPL